MRNLRLALAQINSVVGNLAGNSRKIVDCVNRASAAGAYLVVFPELVISGYPPEDLLLKPSFIRSCRACLDEVATACRDIVAIVGFPEAADDLYNSAAVICNGDIVGIYRKHYLPNYSVFDEDRYFGVGNKTSVFDSGKCTFGVSICEDIWYPSGPPEQQAILGNAELLVNISASPYSGGKGKARERMLSTRASDNVAIVAFCNMVGGQDELIFDGGSVVFDPSGKLLARGAQFIEDLILVDVDLQEVFRQRLHDPRQRKERRHQQKANGEVGRIEFDFLHESQPERHQLLTPHIKEPLPELAEVYQALIVGTRDYVQKNGFQTVLVGLSGGIDSSVVACIGADALGPGNVVGVSMPSQYSSELSRSDAGELAQNLGIRFLQIPIRNIFQSYLDTFRTIFKEMPTDVTEENLQARIRGNILMALSNKFGWLVLTTGNKSENSVGYTTLYGDMAGGLSVIKDVHKMLVYKLGRYRNGINPVIPDEVFVKPPSAELRPDQKDSDTLPSYDDLDPILEAYVENDRDFAQMVRAGLDPITVQRVVQMVEGQSTKDVRQRRELRSPQGRLGKIGASL